MAMSESLAARANWRVQISAHAGGCGAVDGTLPFRFLGNAVHPEIRHTRSAVAGQSYVRWGGEIRSPAPSPRRGDGLVQDALTGRPLGIQRDSHNAWLGSLTPQGGWGSRAK